MKNKFQIGVLFIGSTFLTVGFFTESVFCYVVSGGCGLITFVLDFI